MKKETPEEFLARGGKITKSEDTAISLEELLNKEALMSEDGAKAIADLISESISEGLRVSLKPKKINPFFWL